MNTDERKLFVGDFEKAFLCIFFKNRCYRLIEGNTCWTLKVSKNSKSMIPFSKSWGRNCRRSRSLCRRRFWRNSWGRIRTSNKKKKRQESKCVFIHREKKLLKMLERNTTSLYDFFLECKFCFFSDFSIQ
jgi:hypothetical protein